MKEIATYPPIEISDESTPVSPRTGEPRRTWPITLATTVSYLGIAALAWVYGWHWFRAAYPENYPMSAHLTSWIEPQPGAWLSLTLECCYAALVAFSGAVIGLTGYHAWLGSPRVRRVGFAALVGPILVTVFINWYGLIPLGLAGLSLGAIWLPSAGRFFAQWQQIRQAKVETYRRPDQVFYGRLPRYQ